MRLDHAIFQGPLAADVVLEEHEWEQEFDDRGVWVVQTGEVGKEVDYGVVSDGHGFEDSPDCERISGGINSKGPYAVAIGRQANMLQWGFYAAPDRMTESAKRVFLNALVYMRQFDGHKPLVEKKSRGRSWMKQYVELAGGIEDMEEEYRDSYREYVSKKFPAELIAEKGLDVQALEAWRAENEEYFYSPDSGELQVDAELKDLGVSNRTPAFLDLLVERLSDDPQDELAGRLAARYLGPDGEDGAAALAFLRKNRARLFFSDVGGFRWFVGPMKAASDASATRPSTGKADFDEPVRLKAGGEWIDTGKEIAHSGPLLHDLDDDGKLDLLVGSFIGKIQVFANTGSNRVPVYEDRGFLEAEGKEIKIPNW